MGKPSRRRRRPRLLGPYRRYLDEQDSARFVRRVSKRYTAGTLERLAEHGDRQIRRAAVLALGFVGEYQVNDTLGRALLDNDRTVRLLADNAIRSVWGRIGNDKQRRQLQTVIRLNAAQEFADALGRATRLLDQAPWFAEAWNQRALARMHLGQYGDSIRDCHHALELNPYHFVAATNMGQLYLELDNPVSALQSFRRALRLNPDLEGVRVQVVRLARMVEGK